MEKNSVHRQGETVAEFQRTQAKRFFEYLKKNLATCSMASNDLGIAQKNLCRYKADFEVQNRLWEVEYKKCKETGFKAWYLTTNPAFKPVSNQLELFVSYD
jgi:hypothetical protein